MNEKKDYSQQSKENQKKEKKLYCLVIKGIFHEKTKYFIPAGKKKNYLQKKSPYIFNQIKKVFFTVANQYEVIC